jgi:hypothetical protein
MHTIIPGEAQAIISPSTKLRPKFQVLCDGGEDSGACF